MIEPRQENLRHDVPRVIVAQRVIDKITRGALLYPEPETGEAMIGLIIPRPGQEEPEIYVLDTISPGERAVREWGMFEQGDDWQGDVFHWLYMNWETYRARRRGSYGNAVAAKWDAPLAHVGDWHKQPGDMIEPSGGDAATARRMIADAETPIEHIVAPIVTMYQLNGELTVPPPVPVNATQPEPAALEPSAGTGISAPDAGETEAEAESASAYLEVIRPAEDTGPVPPVVPGSLTIPLPDDGWLVRIDFWYMSKRHRQFVRVAPEVWDDDRLPGLPPVAWHLAHPRRFDQEYSLLTQAGYNVDIVRWDADGKPPFEICFAVFKPGASRAYLLVTSADYPTTMPAARVAPMVTVGEEEDLFEKLYEASSPLMTTQLPDWPWDSKRTLIELVWHFEKTLKEDRPS